MKRLLIVALVYVTSSACGFLLTGTTNAGRVQEIMDAVDARGCIYFRASATPYASVGTLIVGTWGTPAIDLADCWRSLPPLAP